MDTRRRQAYLHALGIQAWVPRPAVRRAGPDSPTAAPDAAPAAGRAEEIAALDWAALEAAVRRCTRCELHATRTQTVFGTGNRDADWLFVGEAPGVEEDRQGEPFVGRAGQLLNAMLFALGLKREAVYIANVLKCRPPNNRDPLGEEVRRCEPYLHRQVALIRPRVIVALGRFAAQSLLKSTAPIGRLRGQLHHYDGIPLVVTYHPAYLLRNPRDKRKAWDDLQRARRVLEDAP